MKMNKPVSIRRVELKEALATTINESGLAPYVIEPILQDLLTQAHRLTELQYKQDLERWEEQQKEEQDDVPCDRDPE